jgi:hypothetical protein
LINASSELALATDHSCSKEDRVRLTVDLTIKTGNRTLASHIISKYSETEYSGASENTAEQKQANKHIVARVAAVVVVIGEEAVVVVFGEAESRTPA